MEQSKKLLLVVSIFGWGGGDSTTLINMDDISIYILCIEIFHIYMYISRSLYTLMVIHYEQTRTSF